MKISRLFIIMLIFFTIACAPTRPIRQAPPAAKKETPPPRPNMKSVWVSGHWHWNGHNYIWKSGHWKKGRKGKKWVNGHWKKTPGGHKWIAGHWK